MKTTMNILLAAILTAGTCRTAAQPVAILPAAAVTANAPLPVLPAAVLKPVAPAAGTNDGNSLVLNFRGAPLESVLDYLSDAAGFIIVLDTQVNGHVDLWSDRPVTRDEAVDLLNSVLTKTVTRQFGTGGN